MEKTNQIRINKIPLYLVPVIAIRDYFIWKMENIYFLILSIFQLLTLSVLPSHWSPAGPFSTSVPLILFIFVDVLIKLFEWVCNYNLEQVENNKLFFTDNGFVKNRDLIPGLMIYLYENDVNPIDGLVNYDNSNDYVKISLSSINGESAVKYLNDKNKIYAGSKIIGFSKGKSVKVLITKCGDDREKLIKSSDSENTKKSEFDDYVGSYMINYNGKILLLLVLSLTLVKLYNNNFNLNPVLILSYIIQNWISFNGIIPFSVKIILIMSRYIQSKFNTFGVKVNNPKFIDDFGKIKKIMSDKTGTITKNKLFIEKVYLVDDIPDEYNSLIFIVNKSGVNFDTTEDFVIFDYVNNTKDEILFTEEYIIFNDQKFNIINKQGLQFDHVKKLSSRLFEVNGRKVLFTKGSIDTLSKMLIDYDKILLDDLINNASINYSEGRLIAFGFKNLDSDPGINLNLMGLIVFNDEIHEEVNNIIKKLNDENIDVNLLTGDRMETALALSKKVGIITGEYLTIDEMKKGKCNCNEFTLLINGNEISNNIVLLNDNISCIKNIVGYNLTPENKRKITEIFENNGICTLSIGDGYNDIGMFEASSISVSIRGNSYVEQKSNYILDKFSKL